MKGKGYTGDNILGDSELGLLDSDNTAVGVQLDTGSRVRGILDDTKVTLVGPTDNGDSLIDQGITSATATAHHHTASTSTATTAIAETATVHVHHGWVHGIQTHAWLSAALGGHADHKASRLNKDSRVLHVLSVVQKGVRPEQVQNLSLAHLMIIPIEQS